MSMKFFGKKVLAAMMALVILVSCMVFSFSASAAVTKMWWNNFEGAGTATSQYGGAEANSQWNSGRLSAGFGNYAAPEQGTDGNDYMALGFGTSNSWKGVSGFRVTHENVTVKGATGAGTSAGYTTNGGANYAYGYFRPQTGKYAVKLDYRVESFNQDAVAGVDICLAYGSFNWNADYQVMSGGADIGLNTSYKFPVVATVATVTKDEVGADWRTAVAYIDIDNATGAELHIFAKRHNSASDSLTGTEVWVDNVEIYQYEQLSDFPTVTFYYNGNKVGETAGIAGTPFTMPTLNGISADTQCTFYSDEACTNAIGLPSVHPATSQNIYVRTMDSAIKKWWNDFEGTGTATTPYKGATANGGQNSGRQNQTKGNYAVVEQDTAGNAYMALGFENYAANTAASGFMMAHADATVKNGTGAGSGGAYTSGSMFTNGKFMLSAGKYAIKLDYRLESISATNAQGIDIALVTPGAMGWNSDIAVMGAGALTTNRYPTTVIATVTKEDLGADWKTAILYLDYDGSGSELHLCARRHADGIQDSLTKSEVWVDNVEIYQYDSSTEFSTVTFYHNGVEVGKTTGVVGTAFTMPPLDGISADAQFVFYSDEACTDIIELSPVYPATSQNIYVRTKEPVVRMWWNDFEGNGTATSQYGGAEANSGWNSGRSNVGNGNYAVLKQGADGNDYMALGFTSSSSWKSASGFKMTHEDVTVKGATGAGSSAGYTTNGGANYAYGYFKPKTGKYAIKLDYRLESISATNAQGVDICLAVGDIYWNADAAIMSGGSQLTNSRHPVTVITTVTQEDAGADWRTAIAYVDINSAAGAELQIFAKRHNSVSDSLTGTEVWVDNVEIYQYKQETDMPTVYFYYEGAEVGSSSGLKGSAFRKPTLAVDVPSDSRLAYYSDEACTQRTSLPTVYEADSQKIYVDIERIVMPLDTVMWENNFNSGSATNWLSSYGANDANGKYNSGQMSTDNQNYAVHKMSGSNGYMALGFGNSKAGSYLSGFTMLHKEATHDDFTRAGYYGNYTGTNYAAGNFYAPIGSYKVSLKYNVAAMPRTEGAQIDLYAAFGNADTSWSGARQLNGFTHYQKIATVTPDDLGDGWKSIATAYVGNLEGYAMHFFIARSADCKADLTGTEVWVDEVQISPSNYTSVLFYYEGSAIGGAEFKAPGSTFAAPTLTLPGGIPTGYKLAYYADAACVDEIDLPPVYPNAIQKVYVKLVKAISDTWSFEKEANNTRLDINTSAATTIYKDNSVKHTGKASARINANSAGNSANLYPQMLLKNGSDQLVSVNRGNNYELTFWVYQPAEHGTYPIKYWVAATNKHAPFNDTNFTRDQYTIATGEYTPAATGVWEKVTVIINDCSSLGTVRLGLIGDQNSAHPFYIDDITLVEMSLDKNAWTFDKMEVGTVLDINTSNAGRTVTVDDFVKYSGYNSIRVNGDSKLSDYFPQVMVKNDDGKQIQVYEGRNYTISFRIYKFGTQPAYGINYWLAATTEEADKEFNRVDPPADNSYRMSAYRIGGESNRTVATDHWELITLEIENCAHTGKLRFGISGDYQGAHMFYVDDISVEENFPVADIYIESFERYEENKVLSLNTDGASISVSTVDRHSGDFAAKVVTLGNNVASAPQMIVNDYHGTPFKVEKGKDYRIKFWVVRPMGQADYDLKYWFAATDSDKVFTTEVNNAIVKPTTVVIKESHSWQSVRLDIKDCPYSGTLRLGITGTTDEAHTFYIDDLSASEYTAGDPDPNAMNFEMYEVGTNLAINQNLADAKYKGNSAIISDEESYTGSQSAYFYSNTNMQNNRAQILVRDGNGKIVTVEKGEDFFISFMIYIPVSEPHFTINYWFAATPSEVDDKCFYGQIANDPEFSVTKYSVYSSLSLAPPDYGVWTEIKIAVMDCPHSGNLRFGITHGTGGEFESHCYIDDIKKFDPEYVTVKFDTNGSEDTYEDIRMMSGMLIPFVGNDPYRLGYEFMGWYTSKDFTKESYIDITTTPIVGKDGDVITLYARWQEWKDGVAVEKGEKEQKYEIKQYTEEIFLGEEETVELVDTGERPSILDAEPVTVTPKPDKEDTEPDDSMPPWIIVVIIIGAVIIIGGGATVAAILLKKNKKNKA